MGPWLVDIYDRSELEAWLAGGPSGGRASVVMVVRGDGTAVREFLPNALDAAKRHSRRVVVWVKDSAIFKESESVSLFGEGDGVLAAVMGAGGTAGGWVTRDRLGVEDADFAFAAAEEARV
ncbi:MAG: hypothetical protein ACC742_12265 [Thermoanaerobaculales bacterium]